MIDPNDNATSDLFSTPKRGRGRPVTGQAKTDAERASAYRLRKKSRQRVARIDDIQAGTALNEAVYDRVNELEKLVFELQKQRDDALKQLADLGGDALVLSDQERKLVLDSRAPKSNSVRGIYDSVIDECHRKSVSDAALIGIETLYLFAVQRVYRDASH